MESRFVHAQEGGSSFLFPRLGVQVGALAYRRPDCHQPVAQDSDVVELDGLGQKQRHELQAHFLRGAVQERLSGSVSECASR
eukprot:3934666-Rhodomonas_salina.4